MVKSDNNLDELVGVLTKSKQYEQAEGNPKLNALWQLHDFIKETVDSKCPDCVIYFTLQFWSYYENKWIDKYPKSVPEEGNLADQYERFYKLFSDNKEKKINFSFVQFVAKELKKVPYIFDISFTTNDNFECEYDSTKKIILNFPISKISVNDSYEIIESSFFESFKSAITKVLELDDEKKKEENEIFQEFYKFLCAYKNCFDNVLKIILLSSKLFTNEYGKDIGFGGAIMVFNNYNLTETDINKLSVAINLKYREIGSKDWIDYSTKRIKEESIKSAVAAIMSRNMSHNLGSHVISGTKNYISNKNFDIHDKGVEKGVYRLFQYLQERMDFISVIINSAQNGYSFYAPLNLKADILDEIAADGRDTRHGCEGKNTVAFLLDNIVKSEKISRYNTESGKKLELILLRKTSENKEGKDLLSFTSELNGDNYSNDFNDINFSVPLGINSRHAFLTIIENYIRNSAKHNNNYPENIDTLLVSIMVEEEKAEDKNGNFIDGYRITIFDNKRISKEPNKENDELQSLKDKLKSIRILDENNVLDPTYKGFKEMLICSAWLRNEYEDWSIIEGKSDKQSKLLDFDTVNLGNIKNSLLFKEHKNTGNNDIEKRQEERKSKMELYTENILAFGVKFWLPKHQLLYYKEITDKEEVYSFPSADYYVVKVNDKSLEKVIKSILPNVFFVENDVTQKDLNEQLSFIIEQYKNTYPEWDNTEIIVSYKDVPLVEISSGVWGKTEDINRIKEEKDSFPTLEGKNVCVFKTHNDAPSNFIKTYEPLVKQYTDNDNDNEISTCRLKFIEGISGGSYNYNLLINSSLKDLDKLRVIQSCYINIAIIDERLYEKYSQQEIGNGITIAELVKYNTEIEEFCASEVKDKKLSKECISFADKYKFKNDIELLRKWKETPYPFAGDNVFYKWLQMKNIFIYNCIKCENKYKLVDLAGNLFAQLPSSINYLSTHYGIIQKMEPNEEQNGIINAYKAFLTTLNVGDQCKVAVHSGRGGVVDKQKDVTFIPLSTIEAQLEDCKYKLSQLFLNLKYKPII